MVYSWHQEPLRLSEIYRDEFPAGARARVESQRLRAYDALEREAQGVDRQRKEVTFLRCVASIFLVFAREACEFAKHTDDPVWSGRELDQRCREFLLEVFIDAFEDRGKDLRIRKMFSSRSHWGYSLDSDVRVRFEKLPEFIEYQELLRDAVDAHSARGEDGDLPEPGTPGQSTRETNAPASIPQATQPADTAKTSEPGEAAGIPVGEQPPPPRTDSGTSFGGRAQKTARRNPQFALIDKKLQEIAKSAPNSHKVVFEALDGRVKVPNGKPFAEAGGWLTGFKRDPARARSWLSKHWSRLKLPPFSPGPKRNDPGL
jgi:hypothetical protein